MCRNMFPEHMTFTNRRTTRRTSSITKRAQFEEQKSIACSSDYSKPFKFKRKPRLKAMSQNFARYISAVYVNLVKMCVPFGQIVTDAIPSIVKFPTGKTSSDVYP